MNGWKCQDRAMGMDHGWDVRGLQREGLASLVVGAAGGLDSVSGRRLCERGRVPSA